MKQLSTHRNPCVKDTDYKSFDCMVSYFYKQRGCQYPWNVHRSLDVPTCLNYSETVRTLRIRDPKKGFGNELFGLLERRARTNKECLVPCFVIDYEMKWQRWENWRSGRSLQIVFADLAIQYDEEHLACDLTCIIGEFGGNLGFFLGGSLLLVFNYFTKYTAMVSKYVHRKWILKQNPSLDTVNLPI